MRQTQTHDYTRRCWGHDYAFQPVDGGVKGTMTGWGSGIGVGDYLILPDGDRTSRYRVTSIRYNFNPQDQWSATVEFAPREIAL